MNHGFPRWRIGLLAFALAWAAARAGGWAGLETLTGMALACLVPGLAALRLLGLHRRPALWTALVAGAISGPMLAGAIVLVSRSGWPVEVLGKALLALFAVIVLWPGTRGRGVADESGDTGSPREDALVLALGAALALLIAVGYGNPHVRAWSDSWFHAALFQEVSRAGIPPQFPQFAGNPVPYPWLFHVYLVGISGVAGPDPFVLMAALNVWVALLLPLGVYRVGRSMGLSATASRWSAIAGVLGTNPFGVVWLVLTSLVGKSHGLGALAWSVENSNFALTTLSFRFPFFQSTLLGRLWTPTAYNFGLVLLTVIVVLLFEVWDRPRSRSTALFGFTFLLLLLWHGLTATALALALAAGVGVAALPGLRADARGTLARVAAIGLATGLAVLLARPYLHMVTLGASAERMVRLHLVLPNLAGLILSMGPVVLAGAIGWARLPAPRQPLVGGMLLGAAVPFLLIDLPGIAEEKFYYPPFLILAACAGDALARAWSGRGIARLLVAICLASALLSAAVASWGFIRDPRPLREMLFPPAPGAPRFLSADEEAALRWVRERAPRDAVFLQSPRQFGTEPLIVFGHRRIYLGMAEAFYREVSSAAPGVPPAPPATWAELKRREALQLAAFSSREMAADSLRMIRSAPWPLYVWWDESLGGGRLSPTLRPGAGVTREVFATRTVRILELPPPRTPSR